MLFGRAGYVGLLGKTQHVLGLDHQHAGGAAREIELHGAHRLGRQMLLRAGVQGAGSDQALALERQGEPRAVLRAGHDLRLAHRLAREKAERLAQLQVTAFPVARERRQIVSGRGHQRVVGVSRGRDQLAVRVALEVEQAV